MKVLGKSSYAAAVYIALAGLQRGMPLVILPFISMVMSPAEYGAASMLTATSLLLTTIIAAPLDSLVFREAARGGDNAPALLRITGLYCYVVIPLATAAIAGCVALFVPTVLGVSGGIWGVALLAVAFQPAMAYYALPVVQARQNLAVFAWLATTSIVLMAATKLILLLVYRLGVVGWVVSDLISAFISAGLAAALVRLPRVRINRSDINSVVRFSVPLIPHKASIWAIASLNRPAMATVSTLTQVGFLSLGWNISSIANLVLSEINRAALPRYSRETFPAPTNETLRTVRLQLTLAFIVPATVGSGLAFAGEWIFPESYWPAFALTGILLVGQAAYGLYLVPTNYLVQTAGTTKPVALASGTGAVVTLVLLLVFGRTNGAVGAGYAIAAGILTMLLIAAATTRLTKLDIAWRTWRSSWTETSLGVCALACSVVALALPVGSNTTRYLAVLALLPAAGSAVLTLRRH